MRRLIRAKYWRCSPLWFHHPRTPNCDTVEMRKIQIANSLPVQYSSCTIKSLQVAAPLPQSIGSPSSSKFSNCLKDEASRWTHLFIKSPSLSTNHHHWNKTTWTLKIITRSRQKDRQWETMACCGKFLNFFFIVLILLRSLWENRFRLLISFPKDNNNHRVIPIRRE